MLPCAHHNSNGSEARYVYRVASEQHDDALGAYSDGVVDSVCGRAGLMDLDVSQSCKSQTGMSRR